MEIMRIFSVLVPTTTGRRNRMCKSVEMCAFLKLNRNVHVMNWSDNDIYVLTCSPMLCNLCIEKM